MQRILLDSSVMAKWFLNEEGSDQARAIQQRFMNGELTIYFAELSLFEIANALHYSRFFDTQEAINAIQAINELGMIRLGYHDRALVRAVELSQQFSIAIYDSYLVALAELLGFDFVTSDTRLLKAVTSLSFVYDLTHYR